MSGEGRLTITIHGLDENRAPVAIDDSHEVSDGATDQVVGNVLSNDSDADGDSLIVSEVNGNKSNVGASTLGMFGEVVVNSDGSFSYSLDSSNPDVQALESGESLVELFTYTATDGESGSSSSLTIEVQQPLYGDANGDGQFDSKDLLLVFQLGEYDDGVKENSTFAEGDWNGDGDFDSADLILALQEGGYSSAAVDEIMRQFNVDLSQFVPSA